MSAIAREYDDKWTTQRHQNKFMAVYTADVLKAIDHHLIQLMLRSLQSMDCLEIKWPNGVTG